MTYTLSMIYSFKIDENGIFVFILPIDSIYKRSVIIENMIYIVVQVMEFISVILTKNFLYPIYKRSLRSMNEKVRG